MGIVRRVAVFETFFFALEKAEFSRLHKSVAQIFYCHEQRSTNIFFIKRFGGGGGGVMPVMKTWENPVLTSIYLPPLCWCNF